MAASPILISTWSFGLRGHAVAWSPLLAGGAAIDAVEGVCTVVEADEQVDSVGRGGLPDRAGEVTVDGAIMLAPHRCGAVAALRGYLHPVAIARRVMEHSDHVLIVGPGGEQFAADQGFTTTDLLTRGAAAKWQAWRDDPRPVDQGADGGAPPLRPIDAPGDGRLFASDSESRWKHHDTIGALALDGRGTLAGACSTSGAPFKHPGRVGDSPIIGHGLYVDPEAGAAVATGSGELIMGDCGAFLAVECLRHGASPAEAIDTVLRRIAGHHRLRPEDQVALITLTPDGRFSTGALRDGFRASLTTTDRNEVIEPEVVMER